MKLLSKIYNAVFSQEIEGTDLSSSLLTDYDAMSKQNALVAVDILIQYKSTVHEFTEEIIEFWSLPRRVMARYHFDDAEQLNEWLDGISS